MIKPQYLVDGELWTSIKTKAWMYQAPINNCEELLRVCPYGQPSDLLWVRETWNTLTAYEEKPDYSVMSVREFVYKADDDRFDKWKPSIFMPKEACRIWLKVTDVRVERLQDISERGAIKEGVELQLPNHLWKNYRPKTEPKEGFSSPFSSYETLWRQINGGESWNSNPWVWVIEFEQIKKIIENGQK
jgi:hypothetical protein